MRESQLDLNLEAAENARDAGFRRLSIANLRWIAAALERLRAFAQAQGEFRMEQFRAWYIEAGHEMPPKPHAWGALTNIAAERRIIAFTGRYEPAQSKRTHAHPVKVWRAP